MTQNHFRLEVLACPHCRSQLIQNDDLLRCTACHFEYPIVNGVPQLLPASATTQDSAHDTSVSRSPVDWLRRSALFPSIRAVYHWLRRLDQRLAPDTPLSRQYNLRWAVSAINRLDAKPGKVILDCGGTDGRYRKLACRDGDEYWNLEYVPSVQKLQPGDMGIIGDIHQAPVSDESFDTIVMLEVLEHLYDPFLAVSECFRTLKPGGFLFLTTPQYCMIHGFPSDYYRYTVYGLQYIAKQTGFSWVRHKSMGGKWLLFYFMLSRSIFPIVRQPPFNFLFNLPMLVFFWLLDTTLLRVTPFEKQRNPDTYGWAVLLQKPISPNQ